jgi:hypothetical protein
MFIVCCLDLSEFSDIIAVLAFIVLFISLFVFMPSFVVKSNAFCSSLNLAFSASSFCSVPTCVF